MSCMYCVYRLKFTNATNVINFTKAIGSAALPIKKSAQPSPAAALLLSKI